jgi:hypothetical protein
MSERGDDVSDDMRRFVAVQECSAGNESVGNEWLATRSFLGGTTLSEVWEWALGQHGAHGRLIICVDEAKS